MARIAAIIAVFATFAALGGIWFVSRGGGDDNPFAQCMAGQVAGGAGAIGGSFELVSETGETVTDKVELQAKVQAARAVQQTLAGHVASMLGHGFLGNLGRQAVQRAGRAAGPARRERIFDEQLSELGVWISSMLVRLGDIRVDTPED